MADFAPQYNLFVIIDKIRFSLNLIFWLIFILSVSSAILKMLEVQLNLSDLVNTLNIIALALFFILEVLVDYILVPQADSKRRDDFLDNSFGSTFSPNASRGYFDNDEIPFGLYKAASNLFENCFFSYSLVKAITIKKTLFPSVVLLSIGAFAYYGFKAVPFSLTLLQAFFSTMLLGGLVKHFILMARLHIIHDAWITIFQLQDFKNNPEKYKIQVYRYWLQYETLHTKIQAGISDKVFNELNKKLTDEWGNMKDRYNIS